MLVFPPVYQRAVRSALICQVLSVLLSFMILDLGEFAVQFLGFSVAFWLLAGVLMWRRRHPSLIERLILGSGPMLIFCIMLFIG